MPENFRLFLQLIWSQMERCSTETGICLGRELSGEAIWICSGELSRSNVRRITGWEISRRKTSREKSPHPNAGLQVCTCSSYDLCHLIVYKIYVTVKVINCKLTIIILKEQKRFRALIIVHKFLNVLKSIGGSAAVLIISRQFLITK